MSSRDSYAILLGSGAFLALFFLVFLIPIAFFLMFLLPLPFMILTAKKQEKHGFLAFFLTGVLLYMFLQEITPLVFLWIASTVGGVMGTLYRTRQAAWPAVLGGTLVTIFHGLSLLLVLYGLTNGQFMAGLEAFIFESLKVNGILFSSLGSPLDDKLMKETVNYVISLLPFFLLMISVQFAALNHIIGRRLLQRLGGPSPALPRVKEWMIPRSIVLYYVITFLLNSFIQTDNGYWSLVVLNLMPLLTYVLAIQGISFIAFMRDRKRWWRGIDGLVWILLFIFPPAAYILSLTGILDLGFSLRNKVGK